MGLPKEVVLISPWNGNKTTNKEETDFPSKWQIFNNNNKKKAALPNLIEKIILEQSSDGRGGRREPYTESPHCQDDT